MQLVETGSNHETVTIRAAQGQVEKILFVLTNMARYVNGKGSNLPCSGNLRPYIDNDQQDLDRLAGKISQQLQAQAKETSSSVDLNFAAQDFFTIFKSLSHLPDVRALWQSAGLDEAEVFLLSHEAGLIVDKVQAS